MAELVNGFLNGIDKDINPTKGDNITLFHLENARILPDRSISAGNIENVKGNLEITINEITQGFNYEDYKILDYSLMKDDIVLFYYGHSKAYFRRGLIVLLKKDISYDTVYNRIVL